MVNDQITQNNKVLMDAIKYLIDIYGPQLSKKSMILSVLTQILSLSTKLTLNVRFLISRFSSRFLGVCFPTSNKTSEN